MSGGRLSGQVSLPARHVPGARQQGQPERWVWLALGEACSPLLLHSALLFLVFILFGVVCFFVVFFIQVFLFFSDVVLLSALALDVIVFY